MTKKLKPVVKHRKTSQEMRKIKRAWAKFSEVTLAKAEQKIGEGKGGWEIHDKGSILSLRKSLVAHIKKGMLQRKDQEEDIALLAMMVWFHRVTQEERDRILEAW